MKAGSTMAGEGLGFTEGPVALDDGSVAFTIMTAGQLSRVSDGALGSSAYIGGGPTGIAVDGAGVLHVVRNSGLWGSPDDVSPGLIAVERDGTTRDLVTHDDGVEAPNDVCFGPDGALYFTDPITDRGLSEPIEGAVYRFIRETSTLTQIYFGALFPNGLAFAPDGRTLFVAESYASRILALTVEDGSVVGESVWHEFGGGQPDGLCLDDRGRVWACLPDRDEIHVLGTGGGLEKVVTFEEGSYPTNCCFFGPRLDRLAVTVSLLGGVLLLEPGVTGLPLHRPSGTPA